jgi:monothiol glutaredoxin
MTAQTSTSLAARPVLDDARRTKAAAMRIAAFHADTIEAVRAAVEKDAIVVVGMAQNPFVKKVRVALNEAKIPFTYLEFGSYFSDWKKRLAVKIWSGWPTFPQVFVKGVLVGGHDETKAAIADGSLRTAAGGELR